MIIDCHGHYTTMPDRVNNFRKAQLEAFDKKEKDPDAPICSDDEIRETLVDAQLKMQAERGAVRRQCEEDFGYLTLSFRGAAQRRTRNP